MKQQRERLLEVAEKLRQDRLNEKVLADTWCQCSLCNKGFFQTTRLQRSAYIASIALTIAAIEDAAERLEP